MVCYDVVLPQSIYSLFFLKNIYYTSCYIQTLGFRINIQLYLLKAGNDQDNTIYNRKQCLLLELTYF